MTPTSVHSTRFKQVIFWSITLLFPILLLLVIEAALRLLNFGGNTDLVVRRMVGGKEYYSINRSVASRYFAHTGTAVPEPSDDIFKVVKGTKTKRIFCLGESTMEGFPYDFNATAPSFLRDRLRTRWPGYDIEVINVGVSAVGSYVVLDFLQELIDYEPDLFVVYVGHNEFYGAYGVGSTVGIQGNEFLTRATLSLLRFRTFLLLRDLYAWVADVFGNGRTATTGTLMAEMIGDQAIRFDSELYHQARRTYQENIRRMIAHSGRRDIPILFSALVSNFRDHPPFHSDFEEQTSAFDRLRWKVFMSQGDSLLVLGDVQSALRAFRAAVAIDSGHALGFYKMATALEGLDRFEDAYTAYAKAKDRDLLRFRASEEFVLDLRTICTDAGVPLAPVDSAFRAGSENGIPGRRLLTEHLHPNIPGYFLMGKIIFESIRQHNLLKLPESADPFEEAGDEFLVRASYVTEFDSLVGAIKIGYLTRQWPFAETPSYAFLPSTPPESIAHSYVKGKIHWSQARYDLAELYASRGEFGKARRECLAVSKVVPYSYEPLLRVADYYRKEGKDSKAKEAYRLSFETEDNPYARVKLGIILLEEEHSRESADEIERAFTLVRMGRGTFTLEAHANGRYLLAVAYAKLGDFSKARENGERALEFNPSDLQIRDLLNQINQAQVRK